MKKEYQAPSMEEIDLDRSERIATSGISSHFYLQYYRESIRPQSLLD